MKVWAFRQTCGFLTLRAGPLPLLTTAERFAASLDKPTVWHGETCAWNASQTKAG
jgi:hypothetical protein